LTSPARIGKAMVAIFEGREFLEREPPAKFCMLLVC
jgi:hypothetical protein